MKKANESLVKAFAEANKKAKTAEKVTHEALQKSHPDSFAVQAALAAKKVAEELHRKAAEAHAKAAESAQIASNIYLEELKKKKAAK